MTDISITGTLPKVPVIQTRIKIRGRGHLFNPYCMNKLDSYLFDNLTEKLQAYSEQLKADSEHKDREYVRGAVDVLDICAKSLKDSLTRYMTEDIENLIKSLNK